MQIEPIELTIAIECSPDDVFAYVRDFSNEPEWQADAVEIVPEPAGPVDVGTRVRNKRKMTDASVRQLRLVVEATDFDAAVTFYRDVLGLPVEFAVDSEGGARVVALQAGRATLEIVNPAQRRLIDELEVGRDVSRSVRVAFEVDDAVAMTDRLQAAGASLLAAPTETPWHSLNARLEGPAGLQLTLFQELEPTE